MYIVFKTFGSIKACTQTSTEIRTGCQRNKYWLATNQLSGRGLCSQSRSCRLRQGCVPEGAVQCALIRQLANELAIVHGLMSCVVLLRYLSFVVFLYFMLTIIW